MAFFYRHNPKKFNYMPRYFNPEEKAWEEKKAAAVQAAKPAAGPKPEAKPAAGPKPEAKPEGKPGAGSKAKPEEKKEAEKPKEEAVQAPAKKRGRPKKAEKAEKPSEPVAVPAVEEKTTVETNEPKKFRPSPVVSPVYGILDKNYTVDDVVDSNLSKTKEFSLEKKVVDFDTVRNKAYKE